MDMSLTFVYLKVSFYGGSQNKKMSPSTPPTWRLQLYLYYKFDTKMIALNGLSGSSGDKAHTSISILLKTEGRYKPRTTDVEGGRNSYFWWKSHMTLGRKDD